MTLRLSRIVTTPTASSRRSCAGCGDSLRGDGRRARACGVLAPACWSLAPRPARAARPDDRRRPGRWSQAPPGATDPLRVYVMTFGPGRSPVLQVRARRDLDSRRPRAGTDRVYNFGTFSFDSPRLILDFLRGRHDLLAVGVVAAGGARRVRAREPDASTCRSWRSPPAGEAGAAGARSTSTPAPRTAPTSTTTSSTTARRACATPSIAGCGRRCAPPRARPRG